MKLKEAIEKRRSIRKYTSKKVEDKLILDLIECAALSPSAKNIQPWFFVICKNEIKKQIADIMLGEGKAADVVEEKQILKSANSVKPTVKVIKEAPILILVFREYDDNRVIGDHLSIGSAIEHICLRATDLGLGSLWIRDIVYTKKDIAKLVGYETMELVSAISIGYPNEFPNKRPRKNINKTIDWK